MATVINAPVQMGQIEKKTRGGGKWTSNATGKEASSTAQSLGTLKHMHLHLTRSFAMASGSKLSEDYEDILCKETEAMSILQSPLCLGDTMGRLY